MQNILGITTEKEKNTESVQSQMNVQEKENNLQSSKIMEIEKIENTPFAIIKLDEGENGFIAVGNSRITEVEKVTELRKKIKTRDWDLITNLIVQVTDNVRKQIDEEEKLKREKALKGSSIM